LIGPRDRVQPPDQNNLASRQTPVPLKTRLSEVLRRSLNTTILTYSRHHLKRVRKSSRPLPAWRWTSPVCCLTSTR